MTSHIEQSKHHISTIQWPKRGKLRHCKIVGTLGPASSDRATLAKLMEAGLNIARLNFSHGDHADHYRNIQTLRELSQETGHPVSILQDLQGPKIRCGKLIDGKQQIVIGETYKLRFGEVQTERETIPIDYESLVDDVSVGHRVMMDDGLLVFSIVKITGEEVHVKADEAGTLKNRKGVNFPDSILSLPALTEKDSRDLLFGLSNGVDYVALSFVQQPADVLQVKEMIQALGSDVPVIAKIEKISAVEAIDEIAEIADGLMVARGDLGVEASVERVPSFQHRIIAAAKKRAKPVIIATQMLESMITNPRASNAEVADVANGVLQGADCVMLSGEMAAGKYPIEAVTAMAEIIANVEQWQREQGEIKDSTVHLLNDDRPDIHRPLAPTDPKVRPPMRIHEAVALSSVEAAHSVNARAIVCLTLTGNIARCIAQWRPSTPIIAISPRRDVIHRLMVVWGVYGITNPLFYKTDTLLHEIPELLRELGIVDSGDMIVITAGIPLSKMSATNMVKVNKVV